MVALLPIYKALADESRLRLLRALCQGRFSVGELTAIVAMGQSRVSRHLKLLLDAELLRVQREGTWAYYEAARDDARDEVRQPLALIHAQADQLPHAPDDEQRRQQVLEQRRQRSRAFHERVAPDWARLRHHLFGDDKVIERVLASVGKASVVADLGCGTGEMLPRLVRRGRMVIGVDASTTMLGQAERKLPVDAQGLHRNIDLRLGALEHLPLADGEAQVALLNMVLHHIADPEAVLREVRRSLAKGGRLVVCDLWRHDDETLRDEYGDQWMGFTPAELERWLRAAGFLVKRVEQVDNGPRPAIVLAVAERAQHEGAGA